MSSTEQTTGHIAPPPTRWPTKPPPVRVRRWRWQWTAVDEASGEVLASGHAPTERWAWTRADAAAKRIHHERMEEAKRMEAAKRIHDERLEAER